MTVRPSLHREHATAGELRLAGMPRTAFTLFELILAIALSVTLVSLIGTAINLYLTRVDNSRVRVEEAQLARTVLAMIADDLRAATIYKPQDTSAIAQLMASGTPFDVDSIDQPGGGLGSGGGGGGSGSGGSGSGGGSGGSGGGGLSAGGASGGSPSMSSPSAETDATMPLGLTGMLEELYVDSTRLPRREELFATATGYTNAPLGVQTNGAAGATGSMASAASMTRPSDLKTVRYFVRPGNQVERGSVATTSLDPAAQLQAGGLVRQEIPRNMRVWAEQSGNSAVLDSGQVLLAPEVVHIEFRYFDGTQVVDYWDMRERSALPVAVEITLWIASATEEADNAANRFNSTSVMNTAHQYQQTVYLPMSQVASSPGGMGASGGMSTGSGSGSGTSSTGGSSTSGGSSFSQ